MGDPQEPIIVLEGDAGVCTFPTASGAMSHDYGLGPTREFFDATGRRLQPVRESPSRLEAEAGEDQSAYVRERVRERLREVIQQLEELSRFLEREEGLPFDQFAKELAGLLNPPNPILDSPGSWGHYACAAHHRW
jgi:hypothetical protein